MNKDLVRIVVVSLVSTIATHYVIKALDKKNLLPKPTQDDSK